MRTSVLSFALLLMAAATGLFAEDTASLYNRALDRQKAGDLNGAVELYRACLDQDPSNVAARSNLGAALAGLGRFDDAIPEYEQALKAASTDIRSHLERNLALAYYKSGRMEDAERLFTRLHEAQPADRSIRLLAADCFLQLGKPLKAVELLQPLARTAGDDKALAYLLGMALAKTGQTIEAQRMLDPILKNTSSAEGNFAMGMAMFAAKDFPSAANAFKQALAINPALPRLNSYYGQALLFTGDPDGALLAFRNQLAADPNDYEANYQRAAILLHRHEFAQAEPLLRRALMLRPRSSEAHLALADALAGENRIADARHELEATIQQWPTFSAAHARLAAVNERAGLKTDAARERQLSEQFAPKVENPSLSGPAKGSIAPRFELTRSDGHGSMTLPNPRKESASVLVFGSYSCPNFRAAAPALNELASRYAGRAPFLLVYIREAHSTAQWQSTINERAGVSLAPAKSEQEKHEYATMCQRKLKLTFPAAVDRTDDAAERAYAAWPSRVYVIDADGRVQYTSALGELDFNRVALESAIQRALTGNR